MSENTLSSEHLLKLAKSKSAGSKHLLMENISDLFLSDSGRLSEHERVLMNDIMVKLLKDVETKIRKALAERLAESEEMSFELVALLANDTIDVAHPILSKSTLLQDEQLIEIIRNRTDSHRMSIAIRAHISTQVSDQLVEHGNEDVLEALIKNENAEISELSMNYLVDESRTVDRFQEPLLNRNDIPFELAHKMYWWVSAALRRKIITDFDIDETALDDALEMVTMNIASKHNDKDNVMNKAIKLVKALADDRKLNAQFIITSLRQEKINLAVAGLAELSGLSVNLMWRIIREKTDESLAVVARAIGMEKEHFATLFLLILQSTTGPKARSTSILNKILILYDKIKPENAKIAVRYWQRDFSYQEAQSMLKDAS
jgi:uncharacterized protein (DUF2336 family)